MKILSLSNCELAEWQGAGYIILNYARGLRKRGHRVDLFGPESFEVFSSLQKARGYRLAFGMLLLALKRLSQATYDVIELWGGESWLTAAVLSRVHGRKYLLIHRSNGLETHHDLLLSKWLGSPLPDGTPRRWYHINRALFMRIAYSKVDAIVTVSEYDRRFAISERYQPEERIVAINNPIDDLFFCSHVQFERPPCVGFCGAWMPNKGIGVIMYDIPRILREFRGCRFKIIGVGQKFCKDRYFPSDVLEQIDVVPYLFSKADLISEYKSLSILIMPSIYESFGLAAAEAMACGCAVVRSRTGFGVELSDREDALLIDPASPCLYNAVRFLLTDEPMRLKIAKSGYRRVQGLRWKFALDKIEHCYSIWLERHRGI